MTWNDTEYDGLKWHRIWHRWFQGHINAISALSLVFQCKSLQIFSSFVRTLMLLHSRKNLICCCTRTTARWTVLLLYIFRLTFVTCVWRIFRFMTHTISFGKPFYCYRTLVFVFVVNNRTTKTLTNARTRLHRQTVLLLCKQSQPKNVHQAF